MCPGAAGVQVELVMAPRRVQGPRLEVSEELSPGQVLQQYAEFVEMSEAGLAEARTAVQVSIDGDNGPIVQQASTSSALIRVRYNLKQEQKHVAMKRQHGHEQVLSTPRNAGEQRCPTPHSPGVQVSSAALLHAAQVCR